MKKTLVPVDFSDASLNALHYSIHLFGATDHELTILHTYKPSTRAFHMISIDKLLEDDARKEMDALIRRIKSEYSDVSIHTKIINSEAVSTISSLGNSGEYDFIVMGTKGASGLKEVFLGSVAGGVISSTSAPVLVIPSDYQYKPLERISFAISDHPIPGEVVKPLRELAVMSNCKINVLHVAEEKKPQIEKFLEPIADLNPSITYITSSGSINEHLVEYLNNDGTQLLCLIRSKKGFFTRLFSKSVTLKQTFNSPVPLLILHS
ncbi:MAG: universal stress protein [Saprospiraceae bacterium]|nr:universal stress protein [Saprospiraceae bacterium]